MRKNKIIYQITPYYPPHLGGLENCVEEITIKLAHLGYEVKVITSDCGLLGKKKINTIPVAYVKSFEVAHTPFSLTLPFELLKIPSESILHIHIANAFFPEMAYLVARIKKLKYVVHFHIDVDASGIAGVILPLYKKYILKNILQKASTVICLTKSQKELLIHKYKVDKDSIEIIPNGVDDKFFLKRNDTRKKENTKLLFVGRLSPQKNLEMLIKSLPLLTATCELHIVGDGDQKVTLKNLVKDLQLKNIYFHGQKSEKELLQYYSDSDIFILPSLNEGMSLALLEAAAAGLPIITMDLPQTREFMKEGAILISDHTSSGLAKGTDRLIQNTDKRKMMSRFNKNLAHNYSWNKVVEKIDMIYKGL